MNATIITPAEVPERVARVLGTWEIPQGVAVTTTLSNHSTTGELFASVTVLGQPGEALADELAASVGTAFEKADEHDNIRAARYQGADWHVTVTWQYDLSPEVQA